MQVRFFSEDLHQVWRTWCERSSAEIRNSINVILDPSPPEQLAISGVCPSGSQPISEAERKNVIQKAVQSLDVGYGSLKPWIRKSLELIKTGSNFCTVCSQHFAGQGNTMIVCPQADCYATSHVACLAGKFLNGHEGNHVIPVSGTCARCTTELQWADLIKELSLRARGKNELTVLLKERRVCKAKVERADQGLSSEILSDETDDAGGEEFEEDLDTASARLANVGGEILADQWLNLAELEDDTISITSAESEIPSGIDSVNAIKAPSRLEIVIEDSEWDGAEVLD